MRHHSVSSLLALCILACGVPVNAQSSRSILPTDSEAARHGLARRWYAYAPIDGVRERIQRVMVVDSEVHVQTNMSRIHVLDGETGQTRWSAQLGRPIANHFGTALNAQSAFVINGSYLYRLSREDGSQLWSLRLPQAANAAPAADESHVIVSTADGRIYLYDVNTRTPVWFYQMNDVVPMPAVFVDDKIAVASQDGALYVFQPASRDPTIRYRTGAALSAPLSTWGRTVLLASRDYSVYSVDVRTGETRWRYPAGNEVLDPLSVIENDVFVTPEYGGLHVLNVETGERRWWNPRVSHFVTASPQRVYASDKYGQLLILDRSNGRLLDTWDTHDFEHRVRNESNDRIYLATRDGLIVCLHEKNLSEPHMHRKGPADANAEAQPGAAQPAENPQP